jgi:hypothetical protein
MSKLVLKSYTKWVQELIVDHSQKVAIDNIQSFLIFQFRQM